MPTSNNALQEGGTGMSAQDLLGQLAGLLAAGDVEVVDCTGTLGPDTPLLKLPPELAKDTPPIKIHPISEYDNNGPFWPGTGSNSVSIPAPISTRPITGLPARTTPTATPTRLPVQKLVAPVNVARFLSRMRRRSRTSC